MPQKVTDADELEEMRVLLAMCAGSLFMCAELLERGVLPPSAGAGRGSYKHLRHISVRCAELAQLKIAPEVLEAMREGVPDA
jgi:hypothetical protein